MKIIKTIWRDFWDGWNDYIRRMAQGQYCHFLGGLAGIIGGALGSIFPGGGSNTLEKILAGIGGAASAAGAYHPPDPIKPEEEYAAREKYETSMMDKRRSMYQQEGFKPQTPRYEIQKDLGIFDPMIKSAVMGSFKDVFGADTVARWGMDFEKMQELGARKNQLDQAQAQQQQQSQQPIPMQANPKLGYDTYEGMGSMRRPWQEQEMQ